MSENWPSQRQSGEGLELAGMGVSFNDELCSLIERAQIFRELSRKEIVTLAQFAQAYRVRKTATVFHEGDKGDALYVVANGKVNLFKEAGSGSYKKIHMVSAGKTMGEMSLLDGLPYSASAVAAETSTLLMITKSRFECFTEEQPVIGLKVVTSIARLMSLRLRQTTGILLDYLD